MASERDSRDGRRAERVRAALALVPTGLLGRMRLVFLTVALLNTVPLVPLTALEPGNPVLLRVAAVVGVTWVCARWIRSAQSGRLDWRGDPAEAVVLAGCGALLGANESADAVVIAAVLFGLVYRGLYASARRVWLGAVLGLGSLVTAALGAQMLGSASAMSLAEVPSQLPLLVTVAAIGHALGTSLKGYDAALARERELREELAHLAAHDGLTGLPDRQELGRRLERAMARALRAETGLAVLFVDLDGFKAVNDELGHDAGDDVLRAVARRLEGCLRRSDSAGRLGGDEFALVAEGVDEGEAVALAERVVEAVSAPLAVGDAEVRVGASVGVALPAHGALDAATLLRKADAAMYVAKRRGGARMALAARPDAAATYAP